MAEGNTHPCIVCSAPTDRRKFCSRVCSERDRGRRRIRARGATECIWCGHMFDRRGHYQQACTLACAQHAKRADSSSAIAFASCLQCRATHVHRQRQHCRPRRTTVPKPKAPAAPRQCMRCAAPIKPQARACDACRVAVKSEARRRSKDRRRAAMRAVEYEPINRRKVYERDGWTCQLCGGAINRKVVVPHPKAATLDHIIPLAALGPHTYANVQAAHFICNAVKSDGHTPNGSQLRLIG